MVLYRNDKEKVICVLTRIEAMNEGKGRAEGRKMSVVLSYHSYNNGKDSIVTDRVDFWNAADITKPQLADRIRKERIGQYIIAMISYQDADHTALAYMSKCGVFSFNKGSDKEKNIILGKPSATQKFMDGDKKGFRIGIPMITGRENVWHSISYYNEDAEKAFGYTKTAKENGNLVVIVAGKQDKWKTKDNRDGFSYLGYRAYEIRKTDRREDEQAPVKDAAETKVQMPESSVMINIGPYKKYPIKSCNILKIPEEKKKKALVWMQYIAEEWIPDDGPNKEDELRQKAEIKRIYAKAVNQ